VNAKELLLLLGSFMDRPDHRFRLIVSVKKQRIVGSAPNRPVIAPGLPVVYPANHYPVDPIVVLYKELK
jgi:hypothetical protein